MRDHYTTLSPVKLSFAILGSDAASRIAKVFSFRSFDIAGTFSRVYLCQQRKHLDKYFAVKILPINDVIKNKQVQHVRNEKEVLKVQFLDNFHSLILV